MTITKSTTTIICDTKIAIVFEVMNMDETGKTEKVLADEYNVSIQTITKHIENLENNILDLIEHENVDFGELVESVKSLGDKGLKEKIEADKAANEEGFGGEKEIQTQVDEPKTQKSKTERKPIERSEKDGLTTNQRSILETYQKQKESGELTKREDRTGRVGRARKNIKTIRYITMEILEKHAAKGTLTEGRKPSIIKEIMKKASTDENTAKQYYSAHKVLFKNAKK